MVRNEILRQTPSLENEIFNIFTTAKDLYLGGLQSKENPSPQDEIQLNMSKIVDGDPIPYGFDDDRNGLDAFIKFNVDQSIIPEYISPESLFEMP